jgi:hypothetical protein
MKRVLNSGSIKLNNVLGSEQQLLERSRLFSFYKSLSQEDMIKDLVSKQKGNMLNVVLFVFEVKAPISLLSIWHKSNLGIIDEFGKLHVDEVYIPPFFYKKNDEDFTLLESKDCNDLFTKFDNYYTASINFYHKLLERGLCKEQAQLILPTGLFATFSWTVGASDLITFIETNKSLSPEMYSYCENFMLYLKEIMPKVTEWIQLNKPII